MLECLQDLENFDGGRTDKEGRENKAREDDRLTKSTVRNLKEDDFEGNVVCLPKSKEFKLLRNLNLLGFQHEKVESEGSLLNPDNLKKPDEQHTNQNEIKELTSKTSFNLYKRVFNVSYIVTMLDHIKKAVESAVPADTNNASEYWKRYEKARANLSAIRKRPERMECFVLSSRDNELFEEGSYASSVQKLMKKDLNQIGVGGNGEVVEAFHQKQHLVIKRTLLRELENSVMPTLDHENLLPWFALVCGERSESRPGQLTCYQIMPKMTEDLSASIRAIGGSVHDHMLNCLQENIPKADISVRAELLRRNTSLVFRGVLEGLDYLHQQELVHRDIKASNILVKRPDACSNSTHTVFTCDCGPQWEVRIADFDSLGQVAVLRERAARRSKRATSGGRGFIKVSTTGTSGYRAPEIFEEFSSSDTNDPQYFSPASDMWAFGGVAIHIVMGFCCPSKQYQFGLMMLADKGMVNQAMKFTNGESESLISRTLGLHHIKEGFPGEKWLDMINFVSRPLKIEPKDRPSAAALLQDPFILHYNPRNTPARNGNSANPPPPNITTAPHSICTNQLQGEQLSSTILVTPCQPQEYSAS
jgi:serine/threonine protein kinase